jgi:hypothetical protein
MAKKRVFVDTNVIFECFRISAWTDLTQRCQVETVDMCITEALTGDRSKAGFIEVNPDLLRRGCHKIHPVPRRSIDLLILQHEKMLNLDDGELHLFAHLHANRVALNEVTVLSTADKGAVLRANDLPDWLDWIQSLQQVLKEAKAPRAKIDAVGYQHTAAFLSKVRTDVRNGVIP